MNQTLNRVATKEREEIKRTSKQKMARWHNKAGGNHQEQESNRQKTMEDIDRGLHPAVNGQSLGETWKQQTEDNGRHWRRATSCSRWTKPRWNVKRESNRQKTMEDIDGGLHPAVDGQSLGQGWGWMKQSVFFWLFFFPRSPAISLGFTTFGWDFCVCDRFLIQPLR